MSDNEDSPDLGVVEGNGDPRQTQPFAPGPQQFETTYTVELPRHNPGTGEETPIVITQTIRSSTASNNVEVSVEPSRLDGKEYDAVMRVLMEMI